MNSLEVFKEGKVFWILLSREGRLNAMNEELLLELYNALVEAEADDGVKVVAIKGKGRAFCAGGDVKEFRERIEEGIGGFIHRLAGILNNVVLKIRSLKKPVVSIVHGYASGAGFSLALATDITIASRSSKFDMGYIRIALSPDGGGSFFLPKVVGLKRASEIIMMGKTIDAFEAKEMSIVNYVFPDDELDGKAREVLEDLSQRPREALYFSKVLINNALFPELSKHLELERLFISSLSEKPSFKEGIKAFFEKRKPSFD